MRLRHILFNAVLIIGFFVLDQVTKIWHLGLSGMPKLEAFGITFAIRPTLNEQLALSIPAASEVFLPVMLVFFLALLGYWLTKLDEGDHRSYYLALILAGAAGNLIDRIFLGGVRDWIEVGLSNFTWSSFNIADIIIVVGILLFLIDALRKGRGHNK